MKVIGKATIVFWLLAIGYLGLYAYGLVMGVITPGDREMIGFTAAAVTLAALLAIHSVRLRHAMQDGKHGDLLRGTQRYREKRGF